MKLMSKQKGFTLIEIIVVLVVLGALYAAGTQIVGENSDTANQSNTTKIIFQSIPSAVKTYRLRRGSLTSLDKTALTNEGVPTNTPWGDAWTVSSVSGSVVNISWPLTSANDAATVGADLVAKLTADGGNVINGTPTYTTATKILAFAVNGN